MDNSSVELSIGPIRIRGTTKQDVSNQGWFSCSISAINLAADFSPMTGRRFLRCVPLRRDSLNSWSLHQARSLKCLIHYNFLVLVSIQHFPHDLLRAQCTFSSPVRGFSPLLLGQNGCTQDIRQCPWAASILYSSFVWILVSMWSRTQVVATNTLDAVPRVYHWKTLVPDHGLSQ